MNLLKLEGLDDLESVSGGITMLIESRYKFLSYYQNKPTDLLHS